MSIFENFEDIENLDSTIPETINNLESDDETVLFKEELNEIELDERTRARGIALQVLFEMDMTDHPVAIILKERLDAVKLEGGLPKFVESIVMGIAPICHEIDIFIAKYATEWPIDQIAVIDRNIIRIAVWEFAISEHTPLKVVINESVELAKVFGSESSQRFVNGVLGSLADHQQDIKTALEEI